MTVVSMVNKVHKCKCVSLVYHTCVTRVSSHMHVGTLNAHDDCIGILHVESVDDTKHNETQDKYSYSNLLILMISSRVFDAIPVVTV